MIHFVSNPELLNRFIPACLVSAESVLDVGAGIRPQKLIKARYHTCIEPHHEYATILRKMNKIVFESPAQEVMQKLSPGAADTVTMLDVVEHLPKAESLEIIQHALRIARKQVIILTPLGFMPQTCSPDAPDPWGLHGNTWQEHRSAWFPPDFKEEEGWDIYICPRYHTTSYQGNHQVKLKHPQGAIWAIHTSWHDCTTWDKLKAHHSYPILWLIALATQLPSLSVALLLTVRHRLVVTLRLKELFNRLTKEDRENNAHS